MSRISGHGMSQEIATLRDRLETGLLEPPRRHRRQRANAPRVPNTTNLYFDHLEAEALVIALDLKGLSVTGGSACASGRSRTLPRPHRHGPHASPRPRQPPLQPDQRHDRRMISTSLSILFQQQ